MSLDPLKLDPSAPLYGARLKVARAQTHLNELGALVTEFLDAKPFGFVHTVNADNNMHRVTLQIGSPPATIGLAIGDCIHNLRSALDLMAVELTREGLSREGKEMSGTELDRAGFLIAANQAVFDANFDKATRYWPDTAKALMRELEPFKDGRHEWSRTVWNLHKLDILDKHKLLIPVGALVSDFSFRLGYSEAVIREKGSVKLQFKIGTLPEGRFPLKDGEEVITYWSPDPELQFYLGAKFDVAFGKDQIMDGTAVLDSLVFMGQVVDSIVGTMAHKAF